MVHLDGPSINEDKACPNRGSGTYKANIYISVDLSNQLIEVVKFRGTSFRIGLNPGF